MKKLIFIGLVIGLIFLAIPGRTQTDVYLMETGDAYLLETGDKILLEEGIPVAKDVRQKIIGGGIY